MESELLSRMQQQLAQFQEQLNLMKTERDASRQDREAWQQMATTYYNVASFLTEHSGSDKKAKEEDSAPPKKGSFYSFSLLKTRALSKLM